MLHRIRKLAVIAGLAALAACDGSGDPVGSAVRAPRTSPTLYQTISYTGFAKPVDNLREYNGTYAGSPGTGTIRYTTLYRDNYNAPNGWEGEGSGKHTGVDIPVPSGTPVYAAQAGQVVESACGSDGFGGRVTIRSENPWAPGTYVYYSYAHLREWYPGQKYTVVQAGTQIGRSGGGTSDVCHGSSTGPHLHFQVDKDDGNSFPYGLPSADTNIPDTGFLVNTKTFNPMVFIQGGYRWEFQENNNDEYWRAINIASGGISDGAFWIDGNDDPYFWRSGANISCGRLNLCSTQIAAEANLYRYVRLDTNMSGCWNPPTKIYFKTSAENYFDEAKSVAGAGSPAPGGGYQPTIDMSANPKWAGIITALRVDPAGNCPGSGNIYMGYIRLVQNQNG